MTNPNATAGSQQAAVDAALVVLKSMGLSPADLTASPLDRAAVPTFADYVPVVSATVTVGTRKAYGSYWNRVTEQWGGRRLDEPTPSGTAVPVAPPVRCSSCPRRRRRRATRPQAATSANGQPGTPGHASPRTATSPIW